MDVESLNKSTVMQLRKVCRDRALSPVGRKTELVQRIFDYESSNSGTRRRRSAPSRSPEPRRRGRAPTREADAAKDDADADADAANEPAQEVEPLETSSLDAWVGVFMAFTLFLAVYVYAGQLAAAERA